MLTFKNVCFPKRCFEVLVDHKSKRSTKKLIVSLINDQHGQDGFMIMHNNSIKYSCKLVYQRLIKSVLDVYKIFFISFYALI